MFVESTLTIPDRCFRPGQTVATVTEGLCQNRERYRPPLIIDSQNANLSEVAGASGARSVFAVLIRPFERSVCVCVCACVLFDELELVIGCVSRFSILGEFVAIAR